jgi:hypothetical protein
MKKYTNQPSSSDIGCRRVGWLDYFEALETPALKKLMDDNRLGIECRGELWIWKDDGKAFETVNEYAD